MSSTRRLPSGVERRRVALMQVDGKTCDYYVPCFAEFKLEGLFQMACRTFDSLRSAWTLIRCGSCFQQRDHKFPESYVLDIHQFKNISPFGPYRGGVTNEKNACCKRTSDFKLLQ
jgi:hypothetical protein